MLDNARTLTRYNVPLIKRTLVVGDKAAIMVIAGTLTSTDFMITGTLAVALTEELTLGAHPLVFNLLDSVGKEMPTF